MVCVRCFGRGCRLTACLCMGAGILCFFSGIVLVLLGWAKVGIIVEIMGMVAMFGTFFPYVVTFLRQVPYVGHLLNIPVVSNFVERLAGRRTPV